MRFEVEDFLLSETQREGMPEHLSAMAEIAAHCANKKLAQWLSASPILRGWHTKVEGWEMHETPLPDDRRYCTHRGRLVCIEET